MTTPEAVPAESLPDVAVYHAPPASGRRGDLTAALADLPVSPVAVDGVGGYAAGNGEGLAVVFGAGEIDTVERPTVRVTTDPAALERAASRRVETIHWGVGDDPAVLAARLGAVRERVATRPTLAEEDAVSAEGIEDADPSLYKYLVETVGDAVYILDEEGRFTFVNDALCEMTGYGREELLGSSVHIIKDDGTVEEAEDALRDLLRDRGAGDSDGISIAKLDVELVPRDGERIPATDRMTLRPLEDGEFAGTVGTLRDVSRQRRRQNLLGGIVEQTRDMMTATDERAVADLVVETATEVFGIDFAVVRRYDPDADALELLASSDTVEEVIGGRPRYQDLDTTVGQAYEQGRTVVRTDLADAVEGVEQVQSGLFCPIGETYRLGLGRRSEEGFTDDERQFVEVLANTAAAAFDRVRREQNLRQYEAIVEAADDMLFTLDEDDRFTLVTRPFARMLGCERSDLIGRAAAEFVADPEVIGEATGADVAVETAFETVDGETVPARLTLAPFAGSFETGLVGTVRDISQLKSARREASRQRRRFTELFETLSDPVADVVYEDGVATVESVNPAFAALCDADARTLQGSTFVAAQNAMPDPLAGALEPVRSPRPELDTSVTLRAEGGERHYLLRTVPYEGDGTDRAFVVMTDVTEVRRRGTHLKVLHRLLRHNLRNETTLIRGHAEQLLAMDTDPTVDEHAATIRDASDELVGAAETSRTVQRVLGMDEGAIERTPVGEVLDRVEQELAAGDYDTAVAVETDGRPDGGTVPFSNYLLVALSELVDNADEHTDTEAVEVTVTGADGDLRIAVADEGPGLPEEQWEVLMGEREITQLQHGDGLGLWLVKWVADRHNARLELERADGSGTTVSLSLPAA